MVFVHRTSASGKSYNPVFAENEWADIIEACHANEVPDTWVADGSCYKDMLINGTNYRIDIIGKNHDDLADGTGKAPLTFQMHDCYATAYPMNDTNTNVGGWEQCKMRTETMPALKLLLPAEVQTGIRPVKKLTSAGNESSSIVTTNDDLFLLTEIEIFGSTTHSFAGEGTQYAYYKAGNSKVKNRNGNAFCWWESSPVSSFSTAFCSVYSSGSADAVNASNSRGVAFGFCF